MVLADLLAGSRGRVAAEIRAGRCTVGEIAVSLGMTANNVRAHLASLQRDRIVEVSGRRPGMRKPTITYRLTADAERLFAVAYEPVLVELGRLMAEGAESRALFAEVGRRLAASLGPMEGLTLERRLEALVSAFRALGATPMAEGEGNLLRIRGTQCPLSNLVAVCPSGCEVARSLVESVLGVAVTERCTRTPSPACCFEAKLAS